jgi:hypothetical protein
MALSLSGAGPFLMFYPKERIMSDELLTFKDLPDTDKPWKIY